MSGSSQFNAALISTGCFAQTSSVRLLVHVRNHRLSGTLEVRGGGARASLLFWRGRLAGASVAPEVCAFQELARELGVAIDELSPEGERVVRLEQTCRRAERTFTFPITTVFGFAGTIPAVAEPPYLVDPIRPIWRYVRDLPVDAEVMDALKAVLHEPLRGCNEAFLDAAELEPDERAICVALSAEPRTLAQIRAMSQRDPDRTSRLVHSLLMLKCVEVAAPVASSPLTFAPPPKRTSSAIPATRTSVPPAQGRTLSGMVRTSSSSSLPAFRASSIPPASRPTTPPRGDENAIGPMALGPTGIAARALKITDEDYFATLGLPKGASIEAVRAAYVRLVKLWHPDRVPKELDALAEPIQRIFVHMTLAHQTLTNPPARQAYVDAAESAKTPRVPRQQVFRAIDRAIDRRDFSLAAAEAQQLVDLASDDAEAQAVLAFAAAAGGDGADEASIKRAIRELDRIIDVLRESNDHDAARPFFYRGLLHQRRGDQNAARRDFISTVRRDDKHVDAQRELRLFEMRARTRSGERSLGGLWAKLSSKK